MSLRRSLLAFTLLGSLVTQAQTLTPNPDQSTITKPTYNEPDRNWVVKVAPLSLLDPDNTIQIGVERLLGRQHAVQAEFGYGWQAINLW